jgi:peptidoglycan/xylan/chitin deacetylase (PgdA/CDA1 family)
VTQQFLDADPAFFEALHDLGATIENHSVSHPDLRAMGRADQQRQICGPVEGIRRRFGAAPRLFRPPYGVYDPTTVEVAGSCGYDAIVLWRADVWEGNMDVQSGDLRAGDIVLFHFRPDLLRSLQAFDRYMAERQLQPGRLERYLPPAAS